MSAGLTQAEREALLLRFHAVPPRRDCVREARHWLAWQLLYVAEELVRLASWLAKDGRRS